MSTGIDLDMHKFSLTLLAIKMQRLPAWDDLIVPKILHQHSPPDKLGLSTSEDVQDQSLVGIRKLDIL